MNSETIDLIATDPPFNKGRDFHATPDSLADGASFEDRWRWVDDVQPEWLDAIRGDEDLRPVWQVIDAAYGASGEDMAAFLCFLGVRLIEMRRVLAPHGSIYVHADDTAGAWIKALMDSIFGRRNFRNAIKWCYTGPSAAKNWFPRKSDTILFYAKSSVTPFNADAVRLPYVAEFTAARGVHGANKGTASRERHERGRVPTDWWADGFLSNVSAWRKERTGYPTQKPVALYERIIAASSNPGDVVLDPFCGCATTPIAAERLGREWIGMDLWDKAHRTVLDRLADEGLAVPEDDAGERMRQARMLTFGEVHYQPVPPVRTDDGEEAVPFLPTPTGKARRQRPAWQRMTKADMVRRLAEAQQGRTGVVCAGCGVELAARYFELDHREPKGIGGEDWITNRVLLCGPCNGRKSHRLTLAGLRADNSKPDAGGETWMVNAMAAEAADARAREAARAIRDG